MDVLSIGQTAISISIAIASALIGAALMSTLAAFTARQKTRELEITYLQRLSETYLSNARMYTTTVYVPLSAHLSRLINAYMKLRDNANVGIDGANNNAIKDDFLNASSSFVQEIDKMIELGAGAFLTNQLEESLRSFIAFLRESSQADQPRIKAIFSYRLGLPLVGAAMSYRRQKIVNSYPSFSLAILGSSVNSRVEELLAAPVTSPEFEQRIIGDEKTLRFLIKEVTLGSHAPGIRSWVSPDDSN